MEITEDKQDISTNSTTNYNDYSSLAHLLIASASENKEII